MANDVNIGRAYFDILAKVDQFERDLAEVQNYTEQKAKIIQNRLNNFKAKFDNALMKMKLSEIEKYAVKLRAELQKKIKMNADIESIERTKIKLRSVQKALNGVQREADETKSKMSNAFSSPLAKIGGFIGALYALRRAWDFAKEAKNAARDAEEIQSKFNQIFSSMRGEAEKTAASFADSFGLAKTTARELLSGTGDLLVGFGFAEEEALNLSKQVNELAQDLASFQNYSGGAKGASEALTKALLGETESAKSLGIVIRQDSKDFKNRVAQIQRETGKTEQQAKAIVILREAYKQSRKAVGDYARTKDELANTERRTLEQLKEIKETLGQGVTPVYRIFIGLISAMSSNMGDASGSISAFGIVMKGLATPLIIIITLIKQIGNLVGTVAASLAHLLTLDFSAAAESVSMGWEIMLKDSETMSNALYNMWVDTAKKVNALDFTPNGNKKGNGGNGNGGSTETITLLKKEVALYEELYYGTEKWYNKSIKLINAQAKEMVEAGIEKTDAAEWEKKKIDELTEAYKRMSAAIDGMKARQPKGRTPKSLSKTDGKESNIDLSDENTFDNFKTEAVIGWADAVVTAADVAYGAMAGFFDDIYLKGEWANSMLEKAFVGMANAFISQVQRMISQWLAFQAIKAAFSLIPGGGAVLDALMNLHTGGTVTNFGNGRVTKAATGADFIVPSGYPNDSYPLLVESGERVQVTPAYQTTVSNDAVVSELKSVRTAIYAMNQTLMVKDFKPIVINNVENAQAKVLRDRSIENKLSKKGFDLDGV